ncbi:MAG TPA: hypothetical protein VHO71_02480 [Caproiciproducens sp.]|nr:hypothetical protein [Caproiciproducens sp.]
MSLNARCNDRGNDRDNLESVSDDTFKDLLRNRGRIVTVFTQSGGLSGRGFTGLLVEANHHFIRLVTTLPSAPRHPFGVEAASLFDHNGCNRLGTSCVIPINKIVCFTFNQI